MNAKFLYATTVALALASSLALAQESRPLTRAEVNKAWAEAAAGYEKCAAASNVARRPDTDGDDQEGVDD